MRDKLKNLLVANRILVNLENGKAFRGILYDSQKLFIVLKQVEILEANNNPIPVSGSVIIHKDKIDFIQVLES